MIKAVIFDLDGTLADTLGGITHFVNRALSAFGLSSLSRERIRGFVGLGARNLLERSLTHLGEPELLEEMFPLYNRIYDAHPHHDLKEYEGITPMLEALRERGIRVAVLSNKPHNSAAPICTHLFGDKIDFVLGNKEGIPHKPDITGVKMVWEALGVTAEECLYAGDSGCDMQTGKKSGMRTIGVAWGFRPESELRDNGADHIIHHPSELIDLLK